MKYQLPIICTTILLLPLSTSARETIVRGSIGTGVDYWERTYDNDTEETDSENEAGETDSDEGDKRQVGIWPEIEITSLGIKDSVSFRYAPVLKYDDVDSSTDVDHYLSLSGQRLVTRNWSFSVEDNFRLSDDPYFSTEQFAEGNQTGTTGAEAEEAEPTVSQEQQTASLTGDELSKDAGRERYWTNALSATTNYTFSETGSLGGGYAFNVLRDDSDGDAYDEYDKHSFFANVAYGFNQSWQTSLGINYIRGLYDENEEILAVTTNENESTQLSDDLDEYGANLRVDYIQSASDSFLFGYEFSGTKYDDERRLDNYAHNLTIGWDHAFDSRTRLIIGAGPSYADAEGVKGEWDYNLYLDFTRDYEQSSFNLLLDKTYDTQNFTGSSDSGLKDTYNATATFSHQYTQNLSFNVYGRYSWESNFTPQDELLIAAAEGDVEIPQDNVSIGDLTYDKDIYEAGVSLNFSFLRYYTAGVRYSYYLSDGERDSDQYSDHRVMLTLTATKDLWRW